MFYNMYILILPLKWLLFKKFFIIKKRTAMRTYFSIFTDFSQCFCKFFHISFISSEQLVVPFVLDKDSNEQSWVTVTY